MGLEMLTKWLGRSAAAIILSVVAAPAAAELPPPVRAMIDAAIATHDKDKVAAVVEAAKAVSPDDKAEIDAMLGAFREEQRELADARRDAERREIRQAGLFDRWEGKGQLGGFMATGNSENIGVTASLNIERVGIDWRHRLRASVDYQETNQITTREQYFASYEPRFDINPGLFAYALAQWDKDEFQGFDSRFAVSGGLGYQVLGGEDLRLSLKAGPAWRRTQFVDGRDENSLAALAGIDFDWQVAENIKVTQDTDLVAEGGGSAVAIIDANTTTINLVTGLETSLIASLTARFSYAIEYDSNPPPNARSTDTMSRLTLVYGF